MFKFVQKLGALLVLLYLKEAERKLDKACELSTFSADTTAAAHTMLATADAALAQSEVLHAESITLENKAKQLQDFFK